MLSGIGGVETRRMLELFRFLGIVSRRFLLAARSETMSFTVS
jgi:hypothetical protein